MPEVAIDIVRGIPAGHLQQAASIYYEAFQHKLTPFIGADAERAVATLAASMRVDNAFIALDNGQVVGIVGFYHGDKPLVDISAGTILKTFGFFRGVGRLLLGILLTREPKRGELLMDGIAVHADARGQGVGSRLFAALMTFAQTEGYAHIRLDVVNTNPRAQQLYERLGFEAVKTESVPFLKSMGFTAVTTMTRSLTESGVS